MFVLAFFVQTPLSITYMQVLELEKIVVSRITPILH